MMKPMYISTVIRAITESYMQSDLLINNKYPDTFHESNKWFLKQQTFSSLYSQPHNAETHIHPPTHQHTQTHPPQSHLQHTNPPNRLQTVPQAAHTMQHSFKINGVMSIELKCEKFLKTQRKMKLHF